MAITTTVVRMLTEASPACIHAYIYLYVISIDSYIHVHMFIN